MNKSLKNRMWNYQVVSTKYDEVTGISEVIINPHTGGSFIGRAKCHPEEAYKSKFFGCEMAEFRAILSYLKVILVEKKAVLDALVHLSSSFRPNSKMRKAIAAAEKDVQDVKEEIERLTKGLSKKAELREEMAKKINKKYIKEFL